MAELILVVDDSVTVRTAARWVAESDGFRVLEAGSLQEARALLRTEHPQTILLDYHLPDGPGLDFCRELRDEPAHAVTRIVMLYGNAHPFELTDASAAGADGSMRKPFRSQPLLDILHGATPEQPAAPAEAPPEAPPAAPTADMEAAMSQASDDDEEINFIQAGQGDGAVPLGEAPPPPGSAASRLPRPPSQSGVSKLPPVPGSGVHRLPPPGGQAVTIAGRGAMPRSPSGAHRTIGDQDIRELSGARRVPAPPPEPEAAPVQAPAAQDHTQEAETGPVPVVGSRRNEPTAEVNVLSSRDARDEDAAVREAAPEPPAARVYQVSEQDLRAIVEERAQALAKEMLPEIARQALAQLLRTELNEQIIRMGVTRRVAQFLDNDLPTYAKQAVDRRLDQNDRE